MPARKPFSPREIFAKTGNTIYTLRNFTSAISPDSYIPASYLTALRRELLAALDSTNLTTYRLPERSPESAEAIYPLDRLDYRDNVANSLAEQFYTSHGVTSIRPALEVAKSGGPRQGSASGMASASGKGSVEVMTCRYCLLRELGACKRFKSASPAPTLSFKEPLTLQSGDISLSLRFDCARCEMHISTAER
jgi:putative protease